jgi:hypothetical protein
MRREIIIVRYYKQQYELEPQENDVSSTTYLDRTSMSIGSFTSLLIAGFDCLFKLASSSAATSNSAMNCSTIRPISARGRSFFFFFLPPLKSRSISSSSPSSAYAIQRIHSCLSQSPQKYRRYYNPSYYDMEWVFSII